MTRILTVSSGIATPNTECTARATQGFSGAANIDANGARATPNSEMLAAPSRKAVQTLAGGPGCSSAAITSHSNSSAGATAAVPMTVGRDSRRFIAMANMPFFRVIYRVAGVRPQAAVSRWDALPYAPSGFRLPPSAFALRASAAERHDLA